MGAEGQLERAAGVRTAAPDRATRTVLQWNADNTVQTQARGLEVERLMAVHSTPVALIQEGGDAMGRPVGTLGRVFTSQLDVLTAGRAAVITAKRSAKAHHRADLSVESATFDACVVDVCIDGDMSLRVISAYRVTDSDPTAFMAWIGQRMCGGDVPDWPVLLGCDANIHSASGMAQRPAPLGREWDLLLGGLREDAGTRCLNVPGTPTWSDHVTRVNVRQQSAIDYTLFYPGPAGATVTATAWRPIGQGPSDHQRLLVDLTPTPTDTRTPSVGVVDRMVPPVWEGLPKKLIAERLGNADGKLEERIGEFTLRLIDALDEGLDQDGGDPDRAAHALTATIQQAAEGAGFLRDPSSTEKAVELTTYGWDARCHRLLARRDAIEAKLAPRRQREAPGAGRSETLALKDEWEQVDEDLQQAVILAKREEWRKTSSQLTATAPVSEAFHLIHKLAGGKCGKASGTIPPLQTADGGTAFTAQQQADVLSVHWEERSSFRHPDNLRYDAGHRRRVEARVSDPAFYNIPANAHPLSLEANEPFTALELDHAVDLIRGTAPGRDGLHRKFLKWGLAPMREELLRLYNLCLETGTVPGAWKVATIVPIPKEAKPSKASHLRGISLLAMLGKVMEHLLKSRLTWLLLVFKCTVGGQTAYAPHRATVHQLLRIVDAAKGAWRKVCHLVFVSFDISRAFDTVWHEGLLLKLREIGVVGNLLRLLASFLGGRGARVRVGAAESGLFRLELGVPQGSVLGPLLWNTYFGYVGQAVDDATEGAEWGAFADDLGVWVEVPVAPGPQRAAATADLQRALDAIGEWSTTWRLAFDAVKTKLMVFSPRGTEGAFYTEVWSLLGVALELVTQMKVLGVWLDSGLTLGAHLAYVRNRAALRVGVLKAVSGSSWGGDTLTLLTLYQSWVRPVMEYASPVWALCGRRALHTLDVLQNEALRVVLRAPMAANLDTIHWDTQSEFLAMRRIQAAARLASSLDRLTHDSECATAWRRWKHKRTINLPPAVLTASARDGYCLPRNNAASPFRFLWMATELLGLEGQDPLPERFEHGLEGTHPPPWHPRLPPVLIPLCPQRPIGLGSAGTRSPEQAVKARGWTNSVYGALLASARTTGKRLLVAHTDGSVTWDQTGGGGMGVAWTHLPAVTPPVGSALQSLLRVDHTDSAPGGRLADIHLMEMGAVLRALTTVNARISAIGAVPGEVWLSILVDRLGVVQTLTAPVPSVITYTPYWELRALIDKEAVRLQVSGLTITIDWLPAHVGTPGNEAADVAAKAAAAASRGSPVPVPTEVSLPRPHSLSHKVARLRSRALQHDKFVAAGPDTVPRLREVATGIEFPPTPLTKVLRGVTTACRLAGIPSLPRAVEVTLARLRGKAEIRPSILNRKGVPCDGSCPYCGDPGGYGYAHFVCDCRALEVHRATLRTALAACKPRVRLRIPDLVGFGALTGTNARVALTAFGAFLLATGLTERLTVIPQLPD